MGCPSLGEHTKLEVVIEESYEFKVNCLQDNAKHTLYCQMFLDTRPLQPCVVLP